MRTLIWITTQTAVLETKNSKFIMEIPILRLGRTLSARSMEIASMPS